ncbi:3-phosphoshikimate 1-carboxyvinyltransferase [Microbacterium gorillae]|uniref:3-phosphoshikimate 1-carboxyvinyltransferase n=1 Tax=Microbacterium gorillae TaxID=1231063 RepID=UPI0005900582|nr:3-phosphoshikimate 1-carboxyvinyltransferase [Microbacterium gorillae]
MTTNAASAPSTAVGTAFRAPTAAAPLRASLTIPGSKSLTNRELVLSAVADGPSRLRAPLHSDDSARMIEGLRALGVEITEVEGSGPFGPDLEIVPPRTLSGGCTIDCGQAGTVMRFLTPLTGFTKGETVITAHESALHRPMGEMISALRDVGVDIDDGGHWALPFTVIGHGHIRGGQVTIDASRSSQFISGLLLVAARFDVGLQLTHNGDRLPSIPHIEMTIDVLRHRGVQVERVAAGEWVVPAGTIRGKEIMIEPDLSNAAPFLAAALVVGGSVTIPGWPAHSTQPGWMLMDLLPHFGARASRRGGALTVTGTGSVKAVDLDLSAAGELAPTLVGLAAFADGPSVFRGIGHIRLHETDRIAALVNELRAVGCGAEELPDGIRVIPAAMHGATWKSYQDHRMATTGALIGLRVPGVVVDDIGTTAKTLPQFPELWQHMLAPDDDAEEAAA